VEWEIRGRWPSVEEVEWRFEELIRTRWRRVGGMPAADVYVREDEMWVALDVPGADAADVAAHAEGPRLVVEGRLLHRPPHPEARPALLERTVGTFRRSFPIPRELLPAAVETRLEGGVLHVHVRAGRGR
jgi:HSP20 family molecular chaperone IbpA